MLLSLTDEKSLPTQLFLSEEALNLFRLVPFFAAWDPEMLKNYVEHGLTPDSNGGFRLKMSGIQEAMVFADCYVAYEVWELLERLDERVELRYIMPGKSDAYVFIIIMFPPLCFGLPIHFLLQISWRGCLCENWSMAQTNQYI